MKKNNQAVQSGGRTEIPGEFFPVSQAAKKRSRTEILKKLFPRGINEAKIWNGFVAILGEGKTHERLSVERLESVVEPKFKLKQRISKYFPEVADKLRIIFHGDMELLRRITQSTWVFSHSHEIYSHDAIVLHGLTADEILLDWAAQSVITMLLRHIGAEIKQAD